jgi:hypothetical protein
VRRIASAVVVLALFAACNRSPTAPDESSRPHGRLSGLVTIGPNCPVEQPNQPCPTPPSAYTLRKVLVYTPNRSALLFTVDIDSQGLYSIDLIPADYLIDLKPTGMDRSPDVPTNVTIHANVVTRVDIRIDTGLR